MIVELFVGLSDDLVFVVLLKMYCLHFTFFLKWISGVGKEAVEYPS